MNFVLALIHKRLDPVADIFEDGTYERIPDENVSCFWWEFKFLSVSVVNDNPFAEKEWVEFFKVGLTLGDKLLIELHADDLCEWLQAGFDQDTPFTATVIYQYIRFADREELKQAVQTFVHDGLVPVATLVVFRVDWKFPAGTIPRAISR